MVLRKMSVKEELGNPAAHFFKSGPHLRTSQNEDLREICSYFPKDVKIEYDLWYDMSDPNHIYGYCYTDIANQFIYLRPADKKFNFAIMERSILHKRTEEGDKILHHLAESTSDKYRLRKDKSEKTHEFVVFLPGTNIFNEVVSKKKLHNAVDQGAKLKMHPITAQPLQAMLKKEFGEENILAAKLSGHQLLNEASIVGSFSNSEMGLIGLAKRKSVFIFDECREVKKPRTYASIYSAIHQIKDKRPSRAYLRSLLSDQSNGLISVHAEDPERNVNLFFEGLRHYSG